MSTNYSLLVNRLKKTYNLDNFQLSRVLAIHPVEVVRIENGAIPGLRVRAELKCLRLSEGYVLLLYIFLMPLIVAFRILSGYFCTITQRLRKRISGKVDKNGQLKL